MQRLAFFIMVVLSFPSLACGQGQAAATPPEGVLPVGKDGKALNLDFETGTLKDWTAEGEAFVGQPIKGDTVSHGDRGSKEPASGPVLDRQLRAARRPAARHA